MCGRDSSGNAGRLFLGQFGLVGFFGCQTSSQAAADNVGPGAFLGFGEGVEAFECFGADADALHLSGGHERIITYPSVLLNVSQWDTVMA